METSRSRISEIDLLRFLAALFVVLFHYSFRGYSADNMTTLPYLAFAPISKYGYLGVQLFFLISGFVILMTAASGSLQKFTVSRLARLYPAFWMCCTLTFLAMLFIGGTRYTAPVHDYLINMTMLSEFFGVRSIDGVYWSLFVELRFYLLVGIVLAIKKIDWVEPLLVAWLVAVVALYTRPVSFLNPVLIVDYAAYFIGGAMFYLIWARGLTWLRSAVIVVAWLLALRQSAGELLAYEKHYNTNFNLYVVLSVVTTCFAAMFLVATRKMGVLSRINWTIVGALTYPLYLLHQNLGYMVFNVSYPLVNRHIVFWGTLLLMFGLAYSVHWVIERNAAPYIRNFANRFIDLARTVTVKNSTST